ncbi:hypothetical protein PGT21_013009 [Puccinia graminis f. sp. tritici]|uniref:Uncharacterized protein n=1 Tax=Puccinia graminis f. sp. tritici TaxID=56615 RepID=A0A5B0QT65_PUCGR|nr:hypothetical protein PGT21_013009 [Puccinia graminis f. sp. tritici]
MEISTSNEKLIAVMRYTLWWLYSGLETAQLSRSAVALQPNDLPKFASEFSSGKMPSGRIRHLDKKIKPSIFALVSSSSTDMARLVLNASGAFDDMRNLPGLAQRAHNKNPQGFFFALLSRHLLRSF